MLRIFARFTQCLRDYHYYRKFFILNNYVFINFLAIF